MRSWMILLVLGLEAAPQYTFAQRSTTATIHVVPETETGEALKPARINMIETSSQKDFGPIFKNLTANEIPFGYYDLTISTPAYKNYHRRLSVFDREVNIRATMQFSTEFTGAERFEGAIDYLPASDKRWWVVLYPLIGSPSEVLETPIEADGRFSLISPGGAYLLAVVQGEKVLTCRKVYVGHNTPLLRITMPEAMRGQ